jgi:hypothetical protein
MRSRFRLVAALLALLSLSLTMAEGVWASTCMPGMGMGTTSATMGGARAAQAGGMAMQTPSGAAEAHGSGRGSGSPETPHCPLAPAPGSCVALSISIPAQAPESLAPSPEGAPAVASPDDARHILLVSSFFRPPRA